MKDLVIGQARIKKELLVLFFCFIAAVLTNVYAIATRGTRWSELVSQLHFTLAVGVVLYLLLGFLRLVISGIRKVVRSTR